MAINIDLFCNTCFLQTVTYTSNNIVDTRKTKENLKLDFLYCPKVENDIRCHIRYDKRRKDYMLFPYEENRAAIKIALIVESPHKDEFTYNYKPLQPLNGLSGHNFEKKILERFKIWFKGILDSKKVYEITIFNPVKYQTSLYHYLNNLDPNNRLPSGLTVYYGSLREAHNANLRNDVWKSLFANNSCVGCRDNFINEIVDYNPDYIVNSCTGSCTKKSKSSWRDLEKVKYRSGQNLKALTKFALIDAYEKFSSNTEYREDTHPVTW